MNSANLFIPYHSFIVSKHMKKVLLALTLPIIMIACAKEEDVNPPLSTPTCEDTTDDGVFVDFNKTERALFINDSLEVPDVATTEIVDTMFLSGRVVRNYQNFYTPSFVFKPKRPMHVTLHLPYRRNEQKDYSWYRYVHPLTDDSVVFNIYNVQQVQLDEGCYRLYYVFEDSARTKVLNKGWYDLIIKD